MKKVNQKGFSIIEVLIVLAIAGLIMLVVFLAVPALQRNARNNGRQSDGAKISAAITQCLSNNNGQYSRCETAAQLGYNTDEFSQLTEEPQMAESNNNITQAKLNVDAAGPDTDQAVWIFGASCDGNDIKIATKREFAVIYATEGSGEPRACIGS